MVAELWEKMIAKAKDDGKPICEEASILSIGAYIPCGQPATKIMHSDRDRRNYGMCDSCADHNLKRGMTEVKEPDLVKGPFYEEAKQAASEMRVEEWQENLAASQKKQSEEKEIL